MHGLELNDNKDVLLKLLFNKKHKIMKLSLEALKERAEATASTELLSTISGGTENACHDAAPSAPATTVTAPSVPTVSHEININVNYGPSGWSVGGGYKIKF